MAHRYDPWIKQLLQAFFADFMTTFVPQEAEQLDLAAAIFRDQEVFGLEGDEQSVDLVAQVPRRSPPPPPETEVLVHTEAQRKREPHFPWRMFAYYAQLRLRDGLPVVPIALLLYPEGKGISRGVYREGVFQPTLTFEYWQISLPSLSAEEYLQRDVPLLAGLCPLMRPARRGRSGKIELLARSRQQIVTFARQKRISGRQALLLFNIAQSAIRPTPDEWATITRQEALRGEIDMDVFYKTWADEMIEVGEARGEARGEAQGLRLAIRRVLARRNWAVPAALEEKMAGLSANELTTLLDRAIDAHAVEDLLREDSPV